MSTKRKALRYGLKKQELGLTSKKQSLATSMKLLRSVLAVGFAMTPWLGGEALAAGQADDYNIVRVGDTTSGTKFYLGKANTTETAHIYAEQASGTVGLNRFTKFDVGANQIANLYFQKQGDNTTLNTLVNTVENKINISGTVNAIRNNKIGGNLYFISPEGMVVGAGGVINAGALMVIGTDKTFNTADAAAAGIAANNWSIKGDSKIEINGQINAYTGIDLQAARIAIQKDADSKGNALLQTGVVFDNVVNTNGLYKDASVVAGERLTAIKDNQGNIFFKDKHENAVDVNKAQGDGAIKVAASSTERNAKTSLWGVDTLTNTVEATVDLGAGANIDAISDVSISANATRQNNNSIVEVWDIMAFTKANVKLDGNVTGKNVDVTANASSYYEAHNAQNFFAAGSRVVNWGLDEAGISIDLNESLATALYDELLQAKVIGGSEWGNGIAIFNNVLEQLYMPFGYADAQANITQGAASTITAVVNANFTATSTATNKETISIQPRLEAGHSNLLDHFGGGLVYVDTASNAEINLRGNVHAGGNLIATSKAVNTSVGSLVLKFPKVNIPSTSSSTENGGNANENNNNANQNNNTKQANLTVGTGSPYVAAAMVINVQDTNAVVNFGTEGEAATSNPKITAGGGLVAIAAGVNTFNSSAVIAEKDDTAVNTAINIGVTNGDANVNAYTTLQGGKIQLNSQNVLNSLSMTTDASSGVEPSGLDWTMNLPPTKEGVQRIGEFLHILEHGEKQENQNNNIASTEWNKAFNTGASIAIIAADNKAITNVASNAKLLSGTDLDILASTTVGDSLITTKNVYNNMMGGEAQAVSIALALEVMENTAEVNIADASDSDAGTIMSATGNVNISATVDNSYNRVDKLIAAVESGWADFLDHWSNWGESGVAEKVDDLQVIIADIVTMRANDPAERFADSKQYTNKAKAAIDLLTQLTGTDKLKSALEGLCNAANYANMYVAASTDKTPAPADATRVATGTIGIQYLDNKANVNIGANRNIVAGNNKTANLKAKVTEQNAILVGKWSLMPDLFNTNGGQTGIGGSVNVQTAHNNSEVTLKQGAAISAGDINLATDNDVINIGLVMGGSKTSELGITGMANYMGGNSYAKTLVDDDVTLTARKTWGTITTKDEAGNETTSEGFITKGVVDISADNNAVIVNVTGDVGYSNGSAVGVAMGITDYDIKTLAQVQNLEANDKAGKGSISANSVKVNAHTGGVINTLSVAGSASATETPKTNNANKDAGGTQFNTQGGRGQNGVENQELQAGTTSNSENNNNNNNNNNETTNNETQQTVLTAEQGAAGSSTNQTVGKTPAASTKKDSTIKVAAAGSVSWNYVADETKAALDGVDVTLTRPSEGSDKTTGVSVMAEDSSYIGSYSGAAAISKIGATDTSKFQASLSGAIGVNDVYKTTESSLKNATITNADNVNNMAQNTGAQVALGLSVGVEMGQRGSGTSINLGGSGSANYVDSAVHAIMSGNTMSNGALNVNNIAYDKDVQVGGGVALKLAKGSATAGAAISINDVDNSILARMEGNTIGSDTALAGSVNNLAVSNLVQVGTATSVGVLKNDGYLMGDVAIAVNMVENQVQAELKDSTIKAQAVNNAARDGKLQSSEKQNQYIAAINSTQNNGIQVELGSYTSKSGQSFVINAAGEYVYSDATSALYGEVVPAEDRPTSLTMHAHQGEYYVLDDNGNKQYLEAHGSAYVYKDTGAAVDLVALRTSGGSISYNEETGELKDNQGRVIIANPDRYYTNGNNKVDVTGAVDATIVDLDVNNALANANGSTGVDFGVNKNADGSMNADQHYTSQNVTVNSSGNVIVGGALGFAIKDGGDQSSFGAAVATNVNDVNNSFNAGVTGSTIKVNGADGVQVKAESNTVMVALAAGAAATLNEGTVTVDVAGSGVANTIDNDTIAKVENSTITASKLAVDATTDSTLVSTAGQLSATVSNMYGGAAGLTWAQNSFDNTTGAYVRGISLNGYNNGSTALAVNAYNDSDMYTIGAGVSGGWTNGALVGAYAANYGVNNTEAVVEKYTDTSGAINNTITNADSVTVKAEDDSNIVTVAGSLGLAGSSSAAVTVGGAVANTNIGASDNKQSVRAALNDAIITMSGSADASDAASVSVQALNDANVVNLALGGGVAVSTGLVGVSAEGSVSVADVHSGTLATMNNVNLTAGHKSVEDLAQTDGDIVSSADALNAVWGSTAAVGAGATVSVLNSDVDTKANVNGGTWSIKSAQVDAQANNSMYDVAMGFNVGGSSVAAVNGQANVAVNTLGNDVEAVVYGAHITASDDVEVKADSSETLHNYAGLLTGAGSATASMGIGATVVVNTINGNTRAVVQHGALQADDVLVQAQNKHRVNTSQTGIGIAASAEGAGTVIGSVAVHDVEGEVKALVDDVDGSLHSLTINADRETEIDTYNNGFALSASMISGSVGAGVTVLHDKSATLAALNDANFTRTGDKATSKVDVKANNKSDVHTEVSTNTLDASLGAAIGVAVEVVNLDAQVGTLVSNSTLGNNNTAFAKFAAQANNNLTNTFQNVTDATSTIGALGVGVGVLNINSQTTTTVDNTDAYADDVQVLAEKTRNVNTVLAGAVIGAGAIGVNLMYTNIGGQLQDVYTYDCGTSVSTDIAGTTTKVDNLQKNYYTTNPTNGTLALSADVQELTNQALARTKSDVTNLENQQLVASGSKDKDILQAINKGSGTSKVEAKVTGGSELYAAQNLDVKARATNNVTGGVYQGTVSVGNVGVSANHIDVQEHQLVDVSSSTLSGNKVAISSDVLGSVSSTMGMGAAGAIGYSDVVSDINHSGSNSINVRGSKITATEQASSASEDALQINAGNSMVIDNKAVPVSAQVVSMGRTVVKGNDAVTVNINLGNDSDANAKNSFATQGITISAHNTPQVKNYIPANVNLGFVTGHGTIVESRFGGSVGVSVTDSNSFTTQDLAIIGQVGELIDHNKAEENRRYTTLADNLAVNVAVEDISVNKSTAVNSARINMNVGALSLTNGNSAPNVEISALNYATTKAKVKAVDVSGIFVTGTNFANTTDNSAISLTVNGGDTGIQAHNLTVQAQKNTEVYANAYGATSGIMAASPAAAEVHHSSSSTTTVNVQGKLEADGALNVQANSNDSVNLKADALTVTGFGDGDASVQSAISNVTTINVNNAELTSVGSLTITAANDISLNKGESKYTNLATNTNLDDNNEYSEMLWGQGYGLGAVGISDITNSVTSSAKVLLKNTEIESTGGSIAIAGYTNEDLLVNGYVFSVGILGNDSITNVTNTIINDEAVELEGSSITTKSPGNAITLSAADDLKLFTYALTETPTGVAGGSDADLKNTITRSNAIALKNANNSLYSTQDINLYAGKKLDGNVAVLDLDAEAKNYNGNMIPGVLMPTVENIVAQNNSVTIAANSNSNSVRHTNIYADAGQELVRVYAARDTSIYGSSSEGGYVTEASGDEKYDKTSNNKVDINGSVTAGSGNVIHITIGGDGDIAIFDDADRVAYNLANNNAALDKDGLKDKIDIVADPITGITKDNSITLGRGSYTLFLLERYNEVMALLAEYSKDGSDSSDTAASAAYSGYQAEAIRLREEMLANGGMYLDSEGKYHIVDARYVDYVEIAPLIASGGNISIQTDTLQSSSRTGTMTVNGSADIDIINNTNLLLKLNTITVDSDGGKLVYNGQALNAADYTIDGLNDKLTNINKNGDSASFYSISATSSGSSSVNIEGNYSGAKLSYVYINEGVTDLTVKNETNNGSSANGGANENVVTTNSVNAINASGIENSAGTGSGADNGTTTSVTGFYTPMADIWVQGNILNQSGGVSITSQHNNIHIAGATAGDAVAISGKTVALSAGGSITQNYTDGIVSVGGSVESAYSTEFNSMKTDEYSSENIGIKEVGPTNGSKATGSYIAGGSVYINATDINVNGVIQSGYGDYYLDMTKDGDLDTVNANINRIKQNYTSGTPITDDAVVGITDYQVVDGGAYWDMYKHCYKYKLNAYYNPYTDKIIVEDVDASGGKIYLTGRIVSTGRGNIICLDGVSNINIQNGTNHGLQVGNLLTHEIEGIVSITDTAGYKLTDDGDPLTLITTIKRNSTEVKYLGADGQYVILDNNSTLYPVSAGSSSEYTATYNPKDGLRYTWTEGEQSTDYTRYEKDVMSGGWGLWTLEEEQKILAEWSKTTTPTDSGSYDGKERLPKANSAVIKETNDTNATHMDYSSKTLDSPVYTVESDTVYHSGVFGCHEHHDVVWTESKGTLKTYYASVKADQPINIKFVGYGYDLDASTASNNESNKKIATININSGMGVDITGNIGNTQVYTDTSGNAGTVSEKGIITINSLFGSIEQKSGSLYGAGIELLANQGIKGINIVAGDNVALALLNLGSAHAYDADVTVNSAVGAKGNLALATVDSGGTGGNAWRTLDITNNSYQGDIWKTSNNTVSAGRINLTTLNGSIYGADGKDSAFVVNVTQAPLTAGDSLSASLNASAYGDINIKQASGDLRLGRVYSRTGDVTLEAAGSLVDALPTEASNKGTEEECIARWKRLALVGGEGSNETLLAIKNRLIASANDKNNGGDILPAYEEYDPNALLYTVAEAIVNPSGDNLTKTSTKDPNVIGHNIKLIAGNSIGYNSGEAQDITLNGILKKGANGNYLNANAVAQLQSLANADITNVSIKTDAQGNTVAVVQDKQTVGVQQITSLNNPADGKLSATAAGNDNKGYILLEGRQEVGNDSFIGSDNVGDFVDLYVDSISSAKGEVNLTSLGNIYNNAASGTTANISGKSLYITAVGALGTASKMLTTDVFGTNKTTDGLSAVAGGNIYLNQTSDHNLILRNISSSKAISSAATEGGAANDSSNKKEIYLGADKSILMGTNGTAEDYYLRADGLELTIEARGGSIGEAVYEQGASAPSYTANDGVRIKNVAESDTDSKVLLKAKNDIYVTTVTAANDGSTAEGSLNLQTESEVTVNELSNVGIVVNGKLNLLNDLNSRDSASVYFIPDLVLATDNNTLNRTVRSADVYLGSEGNVTINATDKIQAGNSITVQAGKDLQLENGTLASSNTNTNTRFVANLFADNGVITESSNFILNTAILNTTANGRILLDNKNNQLQQVNVANTDGSIDIGSANTGNGDLQIAITTPNDKIGGDLTVHNYNAGNANNIILADSLRASGDISIVNEEANVDVNANANISAKNITLQAIGHNVIVAGRQLTATEKVRLDGVDVIVSGGKINAATAELVATDDISLTSGEINVATASFDAQGTSDNETDGYSSITEADGFILAAGLVKAKAKNTISLASQSNELINVLLANNSGNVTVYNGNTSDKNLNIAVLNDLTEGAKVNGNLTVRNYNNNNGLANKIVINNKLSATGDISLINEETDVTVVAGAELYAKNITLQANNNSVLVSGGTITAASTATDAGVVTLKGKDVSVSGGLITANAAVLTTDTVADNETIEGNNVVISGTGKINATTTSVNAKGVVLSGGEITATTANLTAAVNDVSLSSGIITASTANVEAGGAINEAEDFALTTSVLNTSANGKTDLKSTSNQLEKVNINKAGGSVTISSVNRSNANALEVNTDEEIKGSLSVTNIADSSSFNNAILVSKALQATETITLTNKEAGITVNDRVSINAKDIVLNAFTDLNVNGNLTATQNANLTAGTTANIVGNVTSANATTLNASGIIVNGTVATTNGTTTLTSAGNLTFSGNGNGTVSGNAVNVIVGQDFIHNGGAISSDSVIVKANGNIKLEAGSLHATNADLFAVKGYVDESYNNETASVPSYDLQVSNLLRAAFGSNANNSVGVDLGSRYNKLTKVQVATAAGDVLIGNGNTGTTALDVAIMNKEQPVAGNISIVNYNDGDVASNAVTVSGLLHANGNVIIDNQEGDVEVLNVTGASIVGKNISLKATGNVKNNNSINADVNAELIATGDVYNYGNIKANRVNVAAGNNVIMSNGYVNAETLQMTATSGNIQHSNGTIEVTEASLTAGNSITLSNGSLVANTASLAAGNGSLTQTTSVDGKEHELAVKELTVKAGTGVNLASHANKLAKIYLDVAGGGNGSGINIANANTGDTALNICVKAGSILTENITIKNYDNKALTAGAMGNDIIIDGNLETTGKLTLINEESSIHNKGNIAGSEVLMDAVGNVTQEGSITVTGSESTGAEFIGANLVAGDNASVINGNITSSKVTLEAGKNASIVGGNVNAANGSVIITASNNILLENGNMQAGNATLTAANSIVLKNGSMQANDATLVAQKGYIGENYDNTNTAANGYSLAIANTLTVAAGNEGDNAFAIDLGSRFNELRNVELKAIKGDIVVGSGRSADGDLSIAVAAAEVVDGNIVFHNYANGVANRIFLNNSLKATGSISIINDEAIDSTENVGILDTVSIKIGNILPTISLEAGKDIVLKAYKGSIMNTGALKTENISVRAEQGAVLNALTADMHTTGNIDVYANAIGNAGTMQAESGNITLQTVNGILYNDDNATMLSKDGNISLLSEQGNIVNKNGADLISNGGTVTVYSKRGSVENAGDLVARGGNIVLKSDFGDVINRDDFNTLVNNNGLNLPFNSQNITTGSIIMSAANGKLINNVDLEAGKDVTLIAKEGLANFSYNVYAGEDITLTATDGNLLNTSTLESVKGDITLTAEHGNVFNGASQENRKGDIITLGGAVTLKALGKDAQEQGYNVTNYGDIIAVNKYNSDDANAGSIVLQSEYGDVNNYDDFNTYSKNSDANSNYLLTLSKANHKSAGLADTIENYNIATSNITLSAVNGEIVNSKKYLVALGNVTMEAKEGIASYGQVILAGKDINLTDTDGDVFNQAKLISMNGNISLTAANGSVINMIDGDIYALNGNVSLNAQDTASDAVKYVQINSNNTLATGDVNNIPQGAIVVTRRGYMNGDTFIELKSGQVLPTGKTLLTQIGYLNENDSHNFKLVQTVDGEAEAFRAGDVVNRGDIVALNGKNADNTTNPGNVKLVSAHGNIANYDEFDKLDNGATQISYSTTAGITGVNGNIRFNQGTTLNTDANYILAKANLSMEAKEGYLYNTVDMTSGGDLSLVSGKDLLIGINVSDNITAVGDVKLESIQGKVAMDGGQVTSSAGAIEISGSKGVSIEGGANVAAEAGLTIGSDNGAIKIVENSSVTAKDDLLLAAETGVAVEDTNLQSLNGSLSAVAMYGDVNIRELAAAEMVAVGSGSGNVNIGTISGKEVVLYTENDNANIKVTTINAQDSLVLQSDQAQIANEVKSTDGGQLLVDITGTGGGTMQGDLELDLAGDVRFTNINVSNATIKVEGSVGFDRLHTTGELHIISQDMITSVYGKAPVHDTSNYLYYSLSETSSSSNAHEVIHARDFALVKAQNSMALVHNRLVNAGKYVPSVGTSDDGWMYLYIDSPTYQRSNGLLLHIDTGYRSANQRWSAEDLSAKLVDFKSNDAFVAHYDAAAPIFGRYGLVEYAPRSVSEILQDVQSQRVVLQQSNGQLRIENAPKEQKNEHEREERQAANQ